MRISRRSVTVAGAALAGILMAAGACARAEVGDPSVIRTDSAGIRIVTSTAADTTLPWTFEDVATLSDSAGAPFVFTSLDPLGVLADRGGRVYVVTRDPSVVRFGNGLRIDRTLGRRGGGPGELELPGAIGSQGDTLFVHDRAKEALVRWGPALDAIGDRRLDGALAGTNRIAFRTGGFWVETRSFSDSVASTLLRADTLGAPALHRLDHARATELDLGCARISLPPLFSPEMHWSAVGPRVIVAPGAAYAIWMHEGARPIASVRRSVPSRAATLEDARVRYPDGLRLRSGARDCAIPTEQAAERLGLAPVFPVVHRLKLLADGTIWVQRTQDGATEPLLDVFSADGAYVGTLRGMPLPLTSMPGGDLLVAREDAETGGQRIVRVRVSK